MTSSNHQLRIVGLAAAIFVILGAATSHAQTVRLTWVQTGAQKCAVPTTVDYGPTTSYGTTVTANHSASTFWYDITGQTVGATLHYRINACGNTGADATATVGNSSCPNQAWTGQTDEYGGAIMRCPFGHASGFFHVEKISFNGRSQWWYVDPSGNPFWDRGVQALDARGACFFTSSYPCSAAGSPQTKYPSLAAWATAQNQRALNWGFNSWDSYMSELPNAPYGWYGATSGNSVKMETALLGQAATNAELSPAGPIPSAPALSSTSGTGSAATYYVKTTFAVNTNAYGTSAQTGAPSTESSLAVAASNVLVVTSPASSVATGWNVYAATSSGAEVLQNATPIPIGTNWTEPATGLVTGTSAPRSSQCSINEAPMDVIGEVPYATFSGYRKAFPDMYSPVFEQCAVATYQYINGTIKTGMSGALCNASNASNCAAPWVKGIVVDDTDYLFSFKGPGNVSNVNEYPNIAWLATVSNFQDEAYSDPVNYTKRAWVNYLQAKYGAISALNTAWGTGGFYTTFGDSGNAAQSNVTNGSFTATGSATILTSSLEGAPFVTGTVSVQNYYNPPGAPSLSYATTGGSIPASTTVCVELTYQNESTGNAGETNPSSIVCQQSGSSTSTNTLTVQSPPAVLSSDRYGVYACTEASPPTQCTSFTKQLGSSQAINSASALTSVTTSGSPAPTSNTTSTAGGVLQPEYSCTDNGSGAFSGCPAGLNLSASAIRYEGGVISLTFSAAPGNGESFIFSFTGSGYGVGTGVLDEDGRHTAWMGNDPYTLTGAVTKSGSTCTTNCIAASSGVVTDVNAFYQKFVAQYASETTRALDEVDGNHVAIGPDPIASFGGAPPSAVEDGLVSGGIDVLYVGYDPGCTTSVVGTGCPRGSGTVGTNYTNSGMNGNGQAAFNGGDKSVYDNASVPQVIWYEVGAQSDSWWNRSQTVTAWTGTGSQTAFTTVYLILGPSVTTSSGYTPLASPITPNSVSITAGAVTCTDNGSGAITGAGCVSGSVNYTTDAISVTFSSAPANGQAINVTVSGPAGPYYLAPDFATQASRSSQFSTDVNLFENAQGTNSDYYVIGYEWWQWQDANNREGYNEGLVSNSDNAYDGHEDVTGSVACSAPISASTCGGEPGNEGDFIDTVRTTNNSIYSAILGPAKP